MATIFEEAQRSIPEPGGVAQVSGFVPTQATPSPLAAAISGASATSLAIKGVRDENVLRTATEEFQQGETDLLATDEARDVIDISANLVEVTKGFEEGGLSEQETVTLDGMNQVLNKARAAFRNKRIPGSEFRIRMESVLKRYIAENPSIAQELRQSARGVLGFDPTGAAIQAVFDIEKDAKGRKDALTAGIDKALDATSLWDQGLTTEQNRRVNGPKALKELRDKKIQDDEYSTRKQTNELDKVSQLKLAGSDTRYLIGTEAIPSIRGILTATHVKGPDGKDVPNTNATKIGDLTNMMSGLETRYRAKYPNLSPSEIDNMLSPIQRLVNQGLEVASGRQKLELLENTFKANVAAVKADVTNNKQHARIVAASELNRGFVLQPSLTRAFSDFLRDDVAQISAKALATDGSHSPFNASKDFDTSDAEAFNKVISQSLVNMVNKGDPNSPDQVQQFENIILGTMVPMFASPESVRTIEFDALNQVAGNPKFIEFLNNMPNAEAVKKKLSLVTTNYRTAIIQKMGEEVFENYDPESPKPFSLKEAMFGIDREKRVQVQRDVDGSFFFTAKPGMNPKLTASGERIAAGFNKRYASRLNDSIKVAAHLKGHTKYKQLIDIYLEQVPELLPFLAQVKEDVTVIEVQ